MPRDARTRGPRARGCLVFSTAPQVPILLGASVLTFSLGSGKFQGLPKKSSFVAEAMQRQFL